jgi:hypothetical protein
MGRSTTTFAFVDLGSPSTIVSEALFKDFHLDQEKLLSFQAGNLTVSVDSSTVASDSWLPYFGGDNREVEALLPAGILQHYEVVIDYADRRLILAQSGTLQPQGLLFRFGSAQRPP